MKPILTFKLNQDTELPQEIVDEAPQQGRFDDYADYVYETFNIQVSLEDSIAYLNTLGAWSNDELQDLELNTKRIIWIACLDCKENKTNYWYMGA